MGECCAWLPFASMKIHIVSTYGNVRAGMPMGDNALSGAPCTTTVKIVARIA